MSSIRHDAVRAALEFGIAVCPWRQAITMIDTVAWHGARVSLVIGAVDPRDPLPTIARDVQIHVAQFRDILVGTEAPTEKAVHGLLRYADSADSIVLVCCNGGLGRSPALALAALRRRRSISIEDAMKAILRMRPGATPNPLILRLASTLGSIGGNGTDDTSP